MMMIMSLTIRPHFAAMMVIRKFRQKIHRPIHEKHPPNETADYDNVNGRGRAGERSRARR